VKGKDLQDARLRSACNGAGETDREKTNNKGIYAALWQVRGGAGRKSARPRHAKGDALPQRRERFAAGAQTRWPRCTARSARDFPEGEGGNGCKEKEGGFKYRAELQLQAGRWTYTGLDVSIVGLSNVALRVRTHPPEV
jgi:hypothetical protein